MEHGLTRNQIIQELTRSPHGDLKEYIPVGKRAAAQEPEFFAHLVAWNRRHGQIRDAKVALPVVHLSAAPKDEVLTDNALAHLALLDPRNLVRALRFGKEVRTEGQGRAVHRMVERYLRLREERVGWWDATVLQHRASMKTLYGLYHVKPSARANAILFQGKYPRDSVFEVVKGLKDMTPAAAATAIVKRRIPFLVAVGAMGARMKDPDVVLALIESMSAAELVTNSKMLERLGMKSNPALRGAFEAGLQRVVQASPGLTLKTTVAAEAVEDPLLAEKLRGAQERQIDKMGGIDGNWLILGDRSPSMRPAVEFCRQLAAQLARFVKGKVHVVFFDGSFYKYYDATGKSLDVITKETGRVDAGGSATSIGSGLQYALEAGLEFDGIAIVSDGGENTPPFFHAVYPRAEAKLGKQVPVYLYLLRGESADSFSGFMRDAGHDLQTYDLRGGFDYYSLPNVVQTMRTQRHGLVEQIMETGLLRLEDVWKQAA